MVDSCSDVVDICTALVELQGQVTSLRSWQDFLFGCGYDGGNLSLAGYHVMSSLFSLFEGKASPLLSSSLDSVIDSALHDKRLVGTVVAVAIDGEMVYHRAAGYADRETKREMKTDTLFRLASVSKPLVTAAVMTLVNQQKIQLDDVINPWLPELDPHLKDGTRVSITLRQLLSHQAGLSYGFYEKPGHTPYADAGVSDGLDAATITLEENIKRLGTVPLLFSPGEDWHYSLAIDVAGLLIERVYGKTLPEAFKELVADPLSMDNTGFSTDTDSDIATPYVNDVSSPHLLKEGERIADEDNGEVGVTFSPSRIFNKEAFPSGGAGMYSSALDVLHLLEALRLNNGDLLPSELIEEMAKDQTGGKALAGMPGAGFGLGFAILRTPDLANSPLSAGSWWWDGVYGHSWFVDIEREVSVVALTNTLYEGMSGQFAHDLKQVIGKVVETK